MTDNIDDDDRRGTPRWQSVFRRGLFHNRVALVTGGGTGIGRCIAMELAMLGAIVVIASRDGERCRIAAMEMNDDIRSRGGREDSRRRRRDDEDDDDDRLLGRVVAGPSTSIRDEGQVDGLVSLQPETRGA